MKNIYKVKGNIFITSDEEIKDCYVLTDLDKIIKVDESNEEQWHEFNCEKIILATDEQLISDGVQSIDKPFLIWLINNPNCKKIEVNFEIYPCLSDGSEIVFSQASNFGGSEDRRNNINTYINQEITDNKNFIKSFDKKRYKIVIPKEQNKQGIDIQEFEKKANEIIANVGKKETIEQTAKEYENSFKDADGTESVDFIAGAKWQQERSYNEEEMLDILNSFAKHIIINKNDDSTIAQWFEFKKK